MSRKKNKADSKSHKLKELIESFDYEGVKKMTDFLLDCSDRFGDAWMANTLCSENVYSFFGITKNQLKLLAKFGYIDSCSKEGSAVEVWALDDIKMLFLRLTMEHWIKNNLDK